MNDKTLIERLDKLAENLDSIGKKMVPLLNFTRMVASKPCQIVSTKYSCDELPDYEERLWCIPCLARKTLREIQDVGERILSSTEDPPPIRKALEGLPRYKPVNGYVGPPEIRARMIIDQQGRYLYRDAALGILGLKDSKDV